MLNGKSIPEASGLLSTSDVQLPQLQYPLQFSNDDSTPRPLEDLAAQMRVSHSFLHLCFAAGCPNADGAASAANVLLWLFEHYEAVRALCGLAPLASVEDLPAAVTMRLRMANALVTLLEHARTRATNWRQKQQMRMALEQVELLTDRLP